MAALAAAGCGGDGEAPSAGATAEPAGHVHGLGVDPRDGALLVAAHYGLFRVAGPGATPERVSEHAHDLMGFTVAGRDRLLASGHPDPRTGLPSNLGLVESRDRGRTWHPVSLLGEVDFHALDAHGARVAGYDAVGSRLLASADGGREWAERAVPAPLVDVAMDPGDPRRLAASSGEGIVLSPDGGASWRAGAGPPGLLAWPAPGRLYRADPRGALSVSADGGRTWEATGAPRGRPAALAATADGVVHLALEDGALLRSEDGGARWDAVARIDVGAGH